MNINKKIEQIRRQPEHIRLRWVWAMVTLFMVFVFAIWLFSVQMMFKKESQLPNESLEIREALNKIKDGAPSLKDMPLTGTGAEVQNEGVTRADGFQQQLNPDLEINNSLNN